MLVLTRATFLLIALSIGVGDSCAALIPTVQQEIPAEEVSIEENRVLDVRVKRISHDPKVAYSLNHQFRIQPTRSSLLDVSDSAAPTTQRYILFRSFLI